MTNRREYDQSYRKAYRKVVRYASIAFAHEDFDRIADQARSYGMKPAAYMRALVLDKTDKHVMVPPDVAAELKALRLVLRGISNNVNQMAHYSHTIRQVDDEQRLFRHLKELEDAIIDHTQQKIGDSRRRETPQPIPDS